MTGSIVRASRTVVIIGVLVAIASGVFGASVFDHLGQGGFDDPASESTRQLDLERETFGNRTPDVVLIFSSPDLGPDDPAFVAGAREVVDALPAKDISSVTPWYALAEDRQASMIGSDGRHAQVLVSLAGDTQNEQLLAFRNIEPQLESDDLRLEVAGTYAVYSDVNHISERDLRRAELIAMPIVVVLALIIFGSVVAALLPGLVGILALIGALAVVRLITVFTDVSIFAINVITLLGIGLAIDYSLFIISRFREELHSLDDVDDPSGVAIARTMATAGRTVLFSGMTVAGSLASLLIFPQSYLRSMGIGGVAAVAVAMLVALTILPATLRLLGRRVDAGRMPWGKDRIDTEHGLWASLARGVMRRPAVVAVGVTAVLVVLALPFAGASFGNVDYHVLPESSTSRQASEVLADQFGGERSSAGITLSGGSPRQVQAYADAVAELTPSMSVQVVDTEGSVSLLQASWKGGAQSTYSQDVVSDIRAVPFAGEQALVGGIPASTVDLLDSLAGHLLPMVLIVVAVMLVLLFLAFGSVVLPVKAVLMNLLSLAATFGVVTWIFQEGHFEGLLQFDSLGFLDATSPIVMAAVLFGLSMDYEVFLLSRIREEWDATGDNDRAVAAGVQRTGRIITNAALLLGVVVAAFGSSGIVVIKLIGVGMVVALFLDATIVRMLLVPATMKLLGRWNWWAPAPMQRWWERYGLRES